MAAVLVRNDVGLFVQNDRLYLSGLPILLPGREFDFDAVTLVHLRQRLDSFDSVGAELLRQLSFDVLKFLKFRRHCTVLFVAVDSVFEFAHAVVRVKVLLEPVDSVQNYA